MVPDQFPHPVRFSELVVPAHRRLTGWVSGGAKWWSGLAAQTRQHDAQQSKVAAHASTSLVLHQGEELGMTATWDRLPACHFRRLEAYATVIAGPRFVRLDNALVRLQLLVFGSTTTAAERSIASPVCAKQNPRGKPRGFCVCKKPGDTYFHAFGTIIGSQCLTTVFGMGTGVSTAIWSPGKDASGGKAGRARLYWVVGSCCALQER